MMKNNTRRRWMIGISVFISLTLETVSVVGAAQEQKFQALELVREYASEDAFQADNAALLRERRPIVDAGEVIQFLEPETGQVLKQIPKEHTREQMIFTEAERAKLADSSNTEPVVKNLMRYYIPAQGTSYLLVTEYTIKAFHADSEGGPEYTVKHIILYNHRGERIMEMPSDTNMLASSPNNDYFVAYYDGPDQIGEYLYFYTAAGELLRKQPFRHTRLKMNFSSHGEHIAMYSLVGKYFYIFTRQGDLVFQGNYQDYAGKNTNLYAVCVSDDGNHILLSTSQKVFLLNLNGVEQWNISSPSTPIRSVYFDLDKGILYMSPLVSDVIYNASGFPAGSLKMLIIHVNNGKIVEEITDIIYYSFANNKLYVKTRGGIYYEYKIK